MFYRTIMFKITIYLREQNIIAIYSSKKKNNKITINIKSDKIIYTNEFRYKQHQYNMDIIHFIMLNDVLIKRTFVDHISHTQYTINLTSRIIYFRNN